MLKQAGVVTMALLLGCQAPRMDVAGEIERQSGIDHAIVIRDAAATQPIVGTSLGMEQAVRLCLSHDPRVQAALARVREAEADADQARLLPNPVLNVDLRWPTHPGDSQALEATLSGDLIAVLKKPGQIRDADNRLRAGAADVIASVLDVIEEAQTDYANVQATDAQLANSRQRAQLATQLHDLANNRLNAGAGTRLDLLTVDSERLLLSMEMDDLKLTDTEQRLTLSRIIGDPRGPADWTLEPWAVPPDISGDESAWITAALCNRPEIHSKTWTLAALGDEVDLATLATLDGGDIGVHGEHDPHWRLGPTITTPLPIFDFGQASRAKVRAQIVEGRQLLLEQAAEVIEDVRRAYADYIAARDAIVHARNELLPLLQQQRQQAELAYRSGDTDLTTLLQAETALQESELKLVDLQEKATLAMVHLQRAAGGAAVAAAVGPSTQPATQPAASQTFSTGRS